jgi:hypothetical protein
VKTLKDLEAISAYKESTDLLGFAFYEGRFYIRSVSHLCLDINDIFKNSSASHKIF